MEEQTGLMCETEPGDQAAERPLPAPRTDSSATLLALIEQLALDPRADVAKLERIIVMYERLDAREAELAYNAAKGRILKKLARIRIVKNRAVLSQIDSWETAKVQLRSLQIRAAQTLAPALGGRGDGPLLFR